MDGFTNRGEPTNTRHHVAMSVDQMVNHPNVRVASSGSWLDTAR